MIDRDTFGSTLGAMLTGVAVTSGPWLLTTILLVIMRVSAVSGGVAAITNAERVIMVVYAVVIVLSAPIDIVLTRFCADCVYERRCDRITGPLCRALAWTLVTFFLLGAGAMYLCDVGLALAIPGASLAAIVSAQWLLLSAAGGLSSPGIILRAFALGAPVSVLAWWGLTAPLGLGPTGYLLGFVAGQLVTLALLLRGVLRALPNHVDEDAALGPAVREYVVLALAALAFNAGLWVDKLVVWLLSDGQLASQYAALAALAWLSIVPACAWLFVGVETVFHRRFHAFYSALKNGAPLDELEDRVEDLRTQVKTTLRGTAAVQVCVTLVCLMAASPIVDSLGLSGAPPHTISWLLVGAGLQVIAFAATLLLYYFDFRTEALISATIQLTSSGLFTFHVGAPSNLLGAGYAYACAVSAAVAVGLLLWRLPGLLPRTFQSQPYMTET